MKSFDVLLTVLLPALVLLHLLVAPYTKVEESFNLQATRDILVHGIPTHDIPRLLRTHFDHVEFPGAVPRTFVGSVVLAGISQPVLAVTGGRYGQFVVRAVLGIFNTAALLKYRGKVERAFGATAARWFILLLASQFHVLFYASRTLPNMFAFGFSTLAFSSFLPLPPTSAPGIDTILRRHKLGVYYFVLAGVIFRSELALVLATQLLYLLATRSTPLTIRTLIPIGVSAAILALVLSVPIDSYFWQRPIWPELSGFIYNAIEGKSSDWGTSPFHAYFTNFLPKLLLNPMILLVGIPSAVIHPSSRRAALGLLIPSLSFVAIYSFQPHKEARFIIYIVPPLTACASIGASYITTHRSRSLIYGLLFIAFGISILGSIAASTAMLLISSFNYPGGEALYSLHHHVAVSPSSYTKPIAVHMDVLSCMTGVSRFQQSQPTPPFFTAIRNAVLMDSATARNSDANQTTAAFRYDKTEDPQELLDPEFWRQFDYVLTGNPETVIGKWDVVDTIYAYAGIEFLRPGQVATSALPVHAKQYMKLTYANEDGVAKSQTEEKSLDGVTSGKEGADKDDQGIDDARVQELFGRAKELGHYGIIREGARIITRGWWLGPRMEARVWVLKRADDSDRIGYTYK